MKIKRINRIIFAVFVIILLLLLIWIINRNDDATKGLLRNNQDAINSAAQTVFVPVRAIDDTDWVWGQQSAPVELIVYNDLSCQFCNRFNTVLEQIKQAFPDSVRIAYRFYPLNKADALQLAVAAECAGAQDKFFQMYQGIMTAQAEKNESINGLAVDLGLNKKQFEKCLTKEKILDKIMAEQSEAQTFGILGAPSSFLNGQSLPGAYQFDDFQDDQGNYHAGMKTLILQKLSGQ
jgi:protein-disulfide isomerase